MTVLTTVFRSALIASLEYALTLCEWGLDGSPLGRFMTCQST